MGIGVGGQIYGDGMELGFLVAKGHGGRSAPSLQSLGHGLLRFGIGAHRDVPQKFGIQARLYHGA